MRADARKNYEHLLTVARDVITRQGTGASLRDIARRADVGLATLYRHFPTREALLEVLLRTTLDALALKAADLEATKPPDEALFSWLRDAVAFVRDYKGVVDLMGTALADADSALHASCTDLRSAGFRLLHRAQTAGTARADLDGTDLFALIGATGWLAGQTAFASRADHLFEVILGAILNQGARSRSLTEKDCGAVESPAAEMVESNRSRLGGIET